MILTFYDALIDLGVNKIKAKAMYFAVYWERPRWQKTVFGDRYIDSFRGKIGIKSSSRITEVRLDEAMYGDKGFDKKTFANSQHCRKKSRNIFEKTRSDSS